MENKDFLLTLVVLGGLALGGYYLLQRSQAAPIATPSPSPEPSPPPSGSDVVPSPSPFGYSVGDPCKRFPSLCKF
jgi:hypothetical protein